MQYWRIQRSIREEDGCHEVDQKELHKCLLLIIFASYKPEKVLFNCIMILVMHFIQKKLLKFGSYYLVVEGYDISIIAEA